jgi:hypothetical protein
MQASHTGTKPKLLDEVRAVMRLKHYSQRTEKTYIHWIVRFIRFQGNRHPETMAETEIRQFLSYLASKESISIDTRL